MNNNPRDAWVIQVLANYLILYVAADYLFEIHEGFDFFLNSQPSVLAGHYHLFSCHLL